MKGKYGFCLKTNCFKTCENLQLENQLKKNIGYEIPVSAQRCFNDHNAV